MLLIRHRRNTPEELAETPRDQGVEVDIRSQGDHLVIHHDPFVVGGRFEDWLRGYEHGTLILNVKEEGLEARVLAAVAAKGIEDFFFLDQSFPFLIRTARAGERRCAVRVSEYEVIDTAMTLAGMIEWVWVDCFSRFPLTGADAARLQGAGFHLCLVSPELQGRETTEIAQLRTLMAARGIRAEAVCTKAPELWR